MNSDRQAAVLYSLEIESTFMDMWDTETSVEPDYVMQYTSYVIVERSWRRVASKPIYGNAQRHSWLGAGRTCVLRLEDLEIIDLHSPESRLELAASYYAEQKIARGVTQEVVSQRVPNPRAGEPRAMIGWSWDQLSRREWGDRGRVSVQVGVQSDSGYAVAV